MRRGIYLAIISVVMVGTISVVLVLIAFLRPQTMRQAFFRQNPVEENLLDGIFGRSNADIISRANKAVVTVIATRTVKSPQDIQAKDWSFYSDNNIQRGTGAGFIIDPAGLIVTNEHVIKDADRIRVRLSDGTERRAKVIGSERATDLALLKIDLGNLSTLELGDSDAVRVGDPVLAIGNPLEYEHSVTSGIISAKGRKVYNERPYEDYIQTDAAINRGNSGGPLLNKKGEVIGVNTVIRIDGRGISFAVPSNVVKRVISQLRAYGFVPRGFLGLTPANITQEVREGLGLGEVKGVLVADVTPQYPAEKVGIKPYDVITRFNDRPLQNTDDFFAVVAGTLPQQEVELSITRGSQQLNYKVALAARPDEEPARPAEPQPAVQNERPALGFSVRENSPETVRELRLGSVSDAITGGVIITEVDPLSSAAESRLTVGQIILEINRKPIRTIEDFHRITGGLKDGSAVVMRVTYPQQKNMRLVAIRVGEI